MPYKEPISIIMTPSPIVANSSNKFSQVLQLFSQYPLHHLPVVDQDNKLIGIISSNDIPKVFHELCGKTPAVPMTYDAIDAAIKITDLMTTDVVTVTSTSHIDEAFKLFATKKFMSLPVIDNGELVGIVTGRDIFEYVAHIGLGNGERYSRSGSGLFM